MSDMFSSTSSFDKLPTGTIGSDDSELERFLLEEKQKLATSAQIREFTDMCWDKCMDKPGAKLDGKTELCLNNCLDRFFDVSILIANRFGQMLGKQ